MRLLGMPESGMEEAKGHEDTYHHVGSFADNGCLSLLRRSIRLVDAQASIDESMDTRGQRASLRIGFPPPVGPRMHVT